MSGYLRTMALSVVALLLLLAGINLFVNPYGYFDTPKIAGINELALGFNHRLPLAKALAVDHLRPVSLVIGNSRAETGYDPEHPALGGRPSYNLAFGGANIQTVRRYVLEARVAGRLRHVVLVLDFSMFDPSVWKEDADPEVLLTDAAGHRRGAWHEAKRFATILLSGTALSDSWWSLTHQRKPVARYLPSGLRDDAADLDQVIREGGHHDAALRAESSFLAAALRDLDSPQGRASYQRALAELHDIVAVADAHGIRLTVVFNPVHARQTYLFEAAGLWPAYEQWKAEMLAAAGRGKANAVWDFSAVSACTAESLPPKGDTGARMRWYRETSHFRPALGNKVLDRIGGQGADKECPDFGTRLTIDGLPQILASQRQSLNKWINRHPLDVAEIDALASQYGRRP
jgi:hypothetical protein